MPTQEEQIRSLKLRALELKKSGDIEGAKNLLAQARSLEFDNVTSVQDVGDDPAALKRLAVVLKQRGDLDGAREALLKARTLEDGGGAASATAAKVPAPAPVAPPPAAKKPPPEPAKAAAAAIPTAKSAEDDDDDGSIVLEGDSDEGSMEMDFDASGPVRGGSVTFTDEEMLDVDMMTELKSCGMDYPSKDDYEAKALFWKKAALEKKQGGDVAGAMAALNKAKLFQAVMAKLDEIEGDDDLAESEDEFNESLKALLYEGLGDGDDAAAFEEMFGDEDRLDLDDLDDLDASMLKDMMDAGMEIPTPEEIMEKARERKSIALGLKQDGNLVGAKAALVESKRLEGKAERLQEMLDEIERGGGDGDGGGLDALMEQMLSGDGDATPKKKPAAARKVPEPDPVPTKSAEELKKEVFRLKTENKIKEATEMLRLYKKALAAESHAKELERRKELIGEIRKEIDIAEEQIRPLEFYCKFVNEEVGTRQLALWREYATQCADAIKSIEGSGAEECAVEVERRQGKGGTEDDEEGQLMRILNEDVLGFVSEAADPDDGRLQIAILSVHCNADENKALKKLTAKKKGQEAPPIPAVQVEITIQLPPNENDTDGTIDLVFGPSDATGEQKTATAFTYEDFGPSQYVDLPRGKSSHAKTIARRMQRKRIRVAVCHAPPREKAAAGGWFGAWSSSASSKDAEKEKDAKKPAILGRVTVELKDLLSGNCMAGDFPLMDSMGNKEVGGSIRLGIRTGSPYGKPTKGGEDGEEEKMMTPLDMRPYHSMLFRPALTT